MNTPPAITLVPGWGLGRGPLLGLAQTLGAAIVDLPGYRQTPPITNFDAAADHLAASIPPGGTLIGWSLGGMLALACAARHPQAVGRLVLIAGTASYVVRDGWPHAILPAQLAEFSRAVLDDFVALRPRFVSNFNRGDRHARQIVRQLLAVADPPPPRATLAGGLRWLSEVDLRADLPAVRCPVLIVQGAHDPLMPLAGAEMLALSLPDARLEVMVDSAHTPFLSDPQDFLQRLRRFLP